MTANVRRLHHNLHSRQNSCKCSLTQHKDFSRRLVCSRTGQLSANNPAKKVPQAQLTTSGALPSDSWAACRGVLSLLLGSLGVYEADLLVRPGSRPSTLLNRPARCGSWSLPGPATAGGKVSMAGQLQCTGGLCSLGLQNHV